jgi:peptidoglycan hydrolase-like protein with peptidoglycan-binding domain
MTKIMSDVGAYPSSILRLSILSILVGATALFMAVFATSAQASEVNILADSNLTVGSRGENVVVLQSLLSELGYLKMPANVASGYYGPLTKSALAQYQMSQSVSPTAGYFGPMTKIAMHQQFASHNWLAMLGW